MAVPFVPSVSISQSADGSTVIIADTSNYDTNTEGVTLGNILSRVDTINDGLGNLVATVNFATGLLTATITITKDYYLNNNLVFTLADSSTRTGTENTLANNFYNNAAREVSRKLTCCNCSKLCNSAVKADLANSEALTATIFGIPAEAQEAIDAANLLINSEDCGC